MEFIEAYWRALCLGKHNPGMQLRLGDTWLESSTVKKVLVDKSLNVSEQCAAGA